MTADFEGLRKPFPKDLIGKVPATAKRPALDFVGHAAVTDRLNRCAPGWSFSIDERFEAGGDCWVQATLTIDDISRSEYGDGPDPKQAVSNALRRAAMRFGVALDLWSKEDLESSGAGLESSSPAPGTSPETSKGSARRAGESSVAEASKGDGNGKVGEGTSVDGEDTGVSLLDQLYRAYGNGSKVLIAARKLYSDVDPPKQLTDLTEARMQELLERVG